MLTNLTGKKIRKQSECSHGNLVEHLACSPNSQRRGADGQTGVAETADPAFREGRGDL